jgi:hypothetical protein
MYKKEIAVKEISEYLKCLNLEQINKEMVDCLKKLSLEQVNNIKKELILTKDSPEGLEIARKINEIINGAIDFYSFYKLREYLQTLEGNESRLILAVRSIDFSKIHFIDETGVSGFAIGMGLKNKFYEYLSAEQSAYLLSEQNNIGKMLKLIRFDRFILKSRPGK